MADIQTTKSTLSIVAEFADGDDRTINLENPNTAIDLTAQVKAVGAYAKANQPIIGDKAGAAFNRFKSAKIVNTRTTKLDLTQG